MGQHAGMATNVASGCHQAATRLLLACWLRRHQKLEVRLCCNVFDHHLLVAVFCCLGRGAVRSLLLTRLLLSPAQHKAKDSVSYIKY